MDHSEFLIAGLLVAVVGFSAVARRLSVPYPIVFVVGGAVLGFIPGLPQVTLAPAVVLVVFLPPLLYGSSIFANFNDFRSDLRWLALNTVALVLVSMGVVAWAAHLLIPRLPWAAAFVLGAIVSPTDPLAAASIMRRLDVPRRMVSAVEGEGLFNDATALVAYRAAVAAVVAGSFSLAGAGLRFILGSGGGVAIGLVVGWVAARLRERTADDRVNVTMSLLTGYAAYVPADAVGASGVLAAVAAGIYMGIRGPRILPTRARLQGSFVWEIVDFALNAILFVLIGLQLHAIVGGLSGYSAATLALYSLAVTGVVVVCRLVWFLTVPYLVWWIDPRSRRSDEGVGAKGRLVLAWSGMRGAVSLAVALALPLTTSTGGVFPERSLIIFLTLVVICFTIVAQGLSLPPLIRRLKVSDGGSDAGEELRARLVAAKAALGQIDALAHEEWAHDETIERLRALYEYRKRRLAARAGKIEDEGYEERSLAYQQMVQLVLTAQRDALLRLRDDGQVSNEVMLRIVRELDLEESRLEISAASPQGRNRSPIRERTSATPRRAAQSPSDQDPARQPPGSDPGPGGTSTTA